MKTLKLIWKSILLLAVLLLSIILFMFLSQELVNVGLYKGSKVFDILMSFGVPLVITFYAFKGIFKKSNNQQ